MIVFIIIILLILFLLLENCFISKIENFNLDKFGIYIINLDSRIDRFQITSNLLNKYDFKNIIRFSAINGKNLSKNELTKIIEPSALKSIFDNYRKEHYELSYGAVGCSLSHFNLWKKLEIDNLDSIIIFEDDTFPSFNFIELQQIIENYAPNDWDIILFGGIYNKYKNINNYIHKIYSFYQTHAYIINKKGALKLLDKAFPIKKQIDSWLSDLSSDNLVNIYGIIQNKWIQNPEINYTDIQTEIK